MKTPPENKLHQAILDGNIKAIQNEVELGANVNNADGKGRLSLFFAIKNGSIEVAQTVVEFGCSQDHLREGAMACVLHDRSDILSIIIKKLNTINEPDPKTGVILIFQAIENNAEKCIRLITPIIDHKVVNQNGLNIEQYAIEVKRDKYANLFKKAADDEAKELECSPEVSLGNPIRDNKKRL
jgi:hypothetical protein